MSLIKEILFELLTSLELLLFIFGLFLGRIAYFLILFYEGRRKIYFYRCSSCLNHNGFIPIFSWLLKQGKCNRCQKSIEPRCTLVELLMAVSFAILFHHLPLFNAIEMAIFCFMAMIACAVDIRRTILPDTFTIGGMVIVLLGAFLNPNRLFMDAVWGVLVGAGALTLISYTYYWLRKKEGMGLGDVKMMGWIGGLVGVEALLYILMFACFLGVIYSLFSFIYHKASLQVYRSELAFGPYLAFSTYCFALLSNYGIIGHSF